LNGCEDGFTFVTFVIDGGSAVLFRFFDLFLDSERVCSFVVPTLIIFFPLLFLGCASIVVVVAAADNVEFETIENTGDVRILGSVLALDGDNWTKQDAMWMIAIAISNGGILCGIPDMFASLIDASCVSVSFSNDSVSLNRLAVKKNFNL
jgi:hypothetical protein